MPKVQMLVHITGGRADGGVWPVAGDPLNVSDAEAHDLCVAQLARPWPGRDEEEQTVEAAATAQTEALVEASTPPMQWPPDEPARMGSSPAPAPEPVTVEVPGEETGPPRPASSKAEWAAWCVRNGASEPWVESATKQQMMEQYGARP